ncbi:hypothetical protein ACT17C_19470, partial [Bacillus subtilis]
VEIQVLKYEKSNSGYFVKHKALVELTGVNNVKEDKDEIISEVSKKVGYDPNDFGLYGGKISKSSKENQYIIVWEN